MLCISLLKYKKKNDFFYTKNGVYKHYSRETSVIKPSAKSNEKELLRKVQKKKILKHKIVNNCGICLFLLKRHSIELNNCNYSQDYVWYC